MTIRPVAYVESDRTEIKDDNWSGESRIVLADDMPDDALAGVEEFSYLEILFHFHKADPTKVVTGLRHPRNNPNWPQVGIFARRGKNRPNHLGLTVVKLVKIEGRVLTVTGLDAIDGTPVIDIKPLLRGFLPREELTQPSWADEIMANYWGK
ncbi:tRNA (N6-threonylcarbamoyladenosine(37)-N6)-methyltransferase TrmO [candidate division GN15 bacterium]|nr:tRNA (N6-threonylcarbamoyladenosine(37)-N6)-methyltransferase TrmO [candidate division GN15 bacterium]